MGWFSRKKRPDLVLPKSEGADHGAGSAPEEQMPPPDPGRPEHDLTQRMFGMMRAAGMSLVVHGPGSAEDCFQAVTAAAPVFSDSGEVGGGFGTVNGPNHPWMIASGPSCAVFVFFLAPDADIRFFSTQIADNLKKIRAPWQLSTVTHIGETWPRALVEDFANVQARPMWTLARFAHHRPEPTPEPSLDARDRPRAGQRPARFGDVAGTEFLFVEHVRHNPPNDNYDTWERINELGHRLKAARGTGFEHCARDADDRRLDPDWLSTYSMAVHPSGTVLSASHLNHAALSGPPALDLGAIDMRNLNTFRAADRPQGMVSPHHSLYRGSFLDRAHDPRRMLANALSVDLDSNGLGAVVESWGGSAGAVATVEADGRYRHLTFLDGMSGGEKVQLSPNGAWILVDGGSQAWLVETATGNWMPSPVQNAGWWPGRDSCLLTFQSSRPITPVVFDLSRNRVIDELAPLRFARPSGVEFLDRGWHPRVAANGELMLFLTAAGVPADHQRQHGSGSRVGRVDLATGNCELVTDIFLDAEGELERDHVEVRWLDDRWHGDVRLHSELRDRLQPPAALAPERDDPAWLVSDTRQLAGLALQTAFDELRSDPANANASRLMPEIINGFATTAQSYPPHWNDIADWAGEVADFMREPLERGWLNDSSNMAWSRYVEAVDLIANGSASELLS